MTITLDNWQNEAIAHRGDILLCTGRQIGKTTTMAIKAALRMLEKETHIIVASLTEDQAKLIIVMILDYLQKNAKTEIMKGTKKPTQNKITLKNKSQVIARPVGTTGDALRGFTGDILILDEVSRFSELILTASMPTLLSTGGELWLCSTPFGKGTKDKPNFFYKCFLNKDNRFKVIYKPTPQAIEEREINENWTRERKEKVKAFLENQRNIMSSLQFGQEYEAQFLDDLQQLIPDELINKACILQTPQTYPKSNLYLGADIARFGGDECSYSIIHKYPNPNNEKNKEKYYQIYQEIQKYQPTTQTEQDILRLNKGFSLGKIGIDAGAGSLGVGIYDHLLENPQTKRKVVAMNNRAISLSRDGKEHQRLQKEDFYDNFLNMLERGELFLLDNENIRTSLKSVQYEINELTKKVRIFGAYTHIAESLVRAAYLAKKESIKNFRILYI